MMNSTAPMILTALGKSPQHREKTEQQQRQEEKSITRTMMPLVCRGVCMGGGGSEKEEGGRRKEREKEGKENKDTYEVVVCMYVCIYDIITPNFIFSSSLSL